MNGNEYRPPRQPLVSPGGADCHVQDMTATASADLTLAAMQVKLAEFDQWLPIDGDPNATLGRLVEHNSTGPLRLGYGAWRDLLLGVQFINGRGELITAGGRTVKNVAGYDLTKFMVGQRGIFGRLVTLTTRTYRRPTAAVITRYNPETRILGDLFPTSLRPQWMILNADALWCGYLGDHRTIDFYLGKLPQLNAMEMMRRSLREDMDHRHSLWQATGDITLRASVPPTKIVEFVAKAKLAEWVADAAFGVVLGSNVPMGKKGEIRDAAINVGGSAAFISGPDGMELDVSTNPLEQRIIERLKQAFDPEDHLASLPWQKA